MAACARRDFLDSQNDAVSRPRSVCADCVLHYEALSPVQRAFHNLKSVDLRIRSIHHRLTDRMRAHSFATPMAPVPSAPSPIPSQSYLIDN